MKLIGKLSIVAMMLFFTNALDAQFYSPTGTTTYTYDNVDIGGSSPATRLEVTGEITIDKNSHSRGKLRMWKESSASANAVSHGLGTEAFHNTYGPGSSYTSTIGHRFYTYQNQVAAQIGYGGSGQTSGRLNSRFYGNVGIKRNPSSSYALDINGTVRIGSIETIADGGANSLAFFGGIKPTTNGLRDLGISSTRWRTLYLSSGVNVSSDRTLKNNIESLEYGLDEIMKLKPVSYSYKDDRFADKRLGLIAQDLQEVVGEIVSDFHVEEDEKTGELKKVKSETLGVNYTELIPVLINGIQEQQAIIEKQDERISQLEKMVAKSTGNASANNNQVTLTTGNLAKLEQNAPNPFHTETTINYYLPEFTGNASMIITDVSGKVLKNIPLQGDGHGTVTITAKELAVGTYNYTLVVDGALMETQRMILTK